MNRQQRFETAVNEFPASVRSALLRIPENGGWVSAVDVETVRQALAADTATLMLRMVSLARTFAVVPVSGFAVGAVILAKQQPGGGGEDLFLGANMEFAGLSLNQSIHAEQAAAANAWMNDRYAFSTIAVSASPCGLCRQFLYEIVGGKDLKIVMAGPGGNGIRVSRLSTLLPEAFGPEDLGIRQTIGQNSATGKLEFIEEVDDPVARKILREAEKSYAPYSGNMAGCALATGDAGIFYGRNFENAAFNPGLTPIQAAVICANMRDAAGTGSVRRVVLAEKATTAGQRLNAEQFLAAVFPEVILEYYPLR